MREENKMLGYLAMLLGLGAVNKAIKVSDERKYQEYLRTKPDYRVPEQPKKPVRYQDPIKQGMYEKYLRDLKDMPNYAKKQHDKGMYGWKFDDTEN